MFVKDIKLLSKVATEFFNDWTINHNMSSLTNFFIIQDAMKRIINE